MFLTRKLFWIPGALEAQRYNSLMAPHVLFLTGTVLPE